MSKRVWMLDPHSGGKPIPPHQRELIKARIERHAAAKYAGSYARLDLNFRGPLLRIGYFRPPPPPDFVPFRETREEYIARNEAIPSPLCRLRHFGLEQWSCAFFTWSNERFSPCILPSGEWFGTLEEGFDVGAMYFAADR